ncbi:MAG: hypothetical protein Q4C85_01595 [Actinomyces sp.]|uniref:hypothetical protein n=1 Tax=Actinomyces sp. TaxID=29317 RepID=UPI0026DBFD33|nr:hypothetical protein [Actinomyces sp.]MDO4242456.1 hypothetical protein [Actinomyces sp.]
MATYQRTHSAKHRAERLEEINAAKDSLLATRGFHRITLAAIAHTVPELSDAGAGALAVEVLARQWRCWTMSNGCGSQYTSAVKES